MNKPPIAANKVQLKGQPEDPNDRVQQGKIRSIETGSSAKWSHPADIPPKPHNPPVTYIDLSVIRRKPRQGYPDQTDQDAPQTSTESVTEQDTG